MRVRTDVSSTLFLSSPDEYDGGELVVEDTYGAHAVKLPAGDMIVYPGTSLHHVTQVTRGSRIASFFWTESMIADVTRRSMMFDLDMSIIRLNGDHPDHPSVVSLTSLYHNLLRQWARDLSRSTVRACLAAPAMIRSRRRRRLRLKQDRCSKFVRVGEMRCAASGPITINAVA